MTRIRKVLTFSNVVACLALFMALGGTVYAAGKISGTQIKPKSIPGNRLKAGAVATNQLKAKAVTAGKVKPGSLTGTQIKAGSLTGTQINQTTLTGVSAASIGNRFLRDDPSHGAFGWHSVRGLQRNRELPCRNLRDWRRGHREQRQRIVLQRHRPDLIAHWVGSNPVRRTRNLDDHHRYLHRGENGRLTPKP